MPVLLPIIININQELFIVDNKISAGIFAVS
jgi:hypothetical protein